MMPYVLFLFSLMLVTINIPLSLVDVGLKLGASYVPQLRLNPSIVVCEKASKIIQKMYEKFDLTVRCGYNSRYGVILDE
jgi:hypothetical protein